jgi:hypothetical protein
MKKTKMILPLLAFTLAIVGAFGSHQSSAKAALFPGFYYSIAGLCIGLPVGSCNNSPFGAICTFDGGSGVYTEVYETRIILFPNLLSCQTVLRHSLNDGKLN